MQNIRVYIKEEKENGQSHAEYQFGEINPFETNTDAESKYHAKWSDNSSSNITIDLRVNYARANAKIYGTHFYYSSIPKSFLN